MMHISKMVGEGADQRKVEMKIVQVLGEDLYGQSRGPSDHSGRRYYVLYKTGNNDWSLLKTNSSGLDDIEHMIKVEKERAAGVQSSDIEDIISDYK